MMIRAYREIYLSKAQSAMGDAFDYAINGCDIPGSDFIKLFVSSSICRRMENAEPQFLVGKSGIEIAIDVIFETTVYSKCCPLKIYEQCMTVFMRLTLQNLLRSQMKKFGNILLRQI